MNKTLVVALALIAGCGGGSSDPDAPLLDAPRSDAPAGPDYVPTGFTRTPDLSATATHEFAAATLVLVPDTDYAMVIETDAGRLVLDLLEEDAPVAVNSFVFLARHHFFDGVLFHRVIEGFMAQSGDPNTLEADRSAWGFGGAGYQFATESVPENTFDHAGVVGTANAGPGTNSSQFFITFAAAAHLPNTDYTIFAEVTEGLEVLPAIARGEPPATPTAIVRAYVVERPR